MLFKDPEGQRLLLVSDQGSNGIQAGVPWDGSPVPQEFSIIGLGPVKLTVPNIDQTQSVLTEVLGFRKSGTYPSSLRGKIRLSFTRQVRVEQEQKSILKRGRIFLENDWGGAECTMLPFGWIMKGN